MHSNFHEKLKSFVTTDNAKQLQSQLKNVLNSKKNGSYRVLSFGIILNLTMNKVQVHCIKSVNIFKTHLPVYMM